MWTSVTWAQTEAFGPQRPPQLKVIYPKPDQAIGAFDSTFILGSVTPGSALEINGTPIDVYRTGGFLAYLPIKPGAFQFRLKANYGPFTLTVPITVADPQPIPPDSGVIIRRATVRPVWNRSVRAGDEVEVRFDGTIGCDARYWIIGPRGKAGPFPMTELRRERYSDYGSYRRDALLEDGPPDAAPPLRGRYHGIWRVPDTLTTDSIHVIVELTGPSLKGLRTQRPWPDSLYGPPTPMDTTTVTARELAPGALYPVDNLPPRVVELTDSVQILRMGPRLGYLTIFQPYGVRARWWGSAGPWTIVRLAPGYTAWIETEKTRTLPEGAPLPESYIARLNTEAGDRTVSLRVGTSERLPFKVTIDEDLKHVRILIFGATANTDWIEQDPKDDLIEHITWTQLQQELYEVDLQLSEPVWGYDAHYEDRQFVLTFRRPPVVSHDLDGLVIAVDAGHSADPGAIGPTGLMEKDANLKISWQVREKLKAHGARVVMTRLGDENVPLYDRPAISVAEDVDLFVSVHNNAVPDGVNPYRRNGSSAYYYHPFSRQFAWYMHKRLLEATHLDDYGLTNGNFAVIRPTQYPSVLLECAFIILPNQEEMLRSDDFADRIAAGVVKGIQDFVAARLRP